MSHGGSGQGLYAKSGRAKAQRDPISRSILGPEHMAALGAVVAESAYLEMFVDRFILQLSGLKAEALGALMPNNAMLAVKIGTLEKLGAQRLRSKKKQAEWKAIIDRMKANNGERRSAVHGVWWHTRPTGIIEKAMGRISPPQATLAKGGGKLSGERLLTLAEEISAGYWDLFYFVMDTWEVPRRLRAKKRDRPGLQRIK